MRSEARLTYPYRLLVLAPPVALVVLLYEVSGYPEQQRRNNLGGFGELWRS